MTMKVSDTVWVVQCQDTDSDHHGRFYLGSGIGQTLSAAQIYSTEEGAQKSARKRNKDYNGAGHFHAKGWVAVECVITLR